MAKYVVFLHKKDSNDFGITKGIQIHIHAKNLHDAMMAASRKANKKFTAPHPWWVPDFAIKGL